jgi:hypothetical protein
VAAHELSVLAAKRTSRSPPDQSYVSWVGSTTCHFISLPGVTVENCSPAIFA